MKKINFKLILLSFFALALLLVVGNTSYSLLTNSFIDNVKVDKEKSKYLSFNYSDVSNVFYISDVNKLSDFRGKRQVINYYDFEVDVDGEFELIIKDLSNSIPSNYLKVYLTDQYNRVIESFDGNVPVYSAFKDSKDGKVIYSGSDKHKKYRLRIWVSDKYKGKIKDDLVFQIDVRTK